MLSHRSNTRALGTHSSRRTMTSQGDAPRGRNALVSCILGADTELGRYVALGQAKESARLVLLGEKSNKALMEDLGRQCSCIGCPAVDVYFHSSDSAKEIHMMTSLARSRMEAIDLLTICPLVAPSTTNAAIIKDAVQRMGQECLPRMRERQNMDTGASSPMTTLAEKVAQATMGTAAQLAAATGAVTSTLAPGVAVGAVHGTLQHWLREEAKAAEGSGLLFVEVSVPEGLFTGELFKQDQQLAQHLAHEAAYHSLDPWRARAGTNYQLTLQAHGKAKQPSPSQLLTITVPHHRRPPALTTPTDPLHPRPVGDIELLSEDPSKPHAAAAEPYGMPSDWEDDQHNPRAPVVTASESVLTSAGDPERAQLGHDPGPDTRGQEGTLRAAHPGRAVWLMPEDPPPPTGIDEASGARVTPGVLVRLRAPRELGLAAVDKPGAVLTASPPENLEPEVHEGEYNQEPTDRDPLLNVHCLYPFNAETPHDVLSKEFITPAPLFYVRNHLPVPERPDLNTYRITLRGAGVSHQLSLSDLQSGRYGSVIDQEVTLQCAGNRRNELASVKLVQGRAPWNHGSIGNSVWTGVLLKDVLQACGFAASDPNAGSATYVIMRGLDWHRISKKHYETSVPMSKVQDPNGGVLLAWQQNHEALLLDHGFPMRAIVPGYVGSRSVKWLESIEVSDHESDSPWTQVDYKLMPHRYHDIQEWKPVAADLMPPIMNLPVQSAILVPKPGTVVPAGTEALWVRGYAWSGAGVEIIRVDVTVDEGATWELADIVEKHKTPDGRAWAWVKWQVPLQVPKHLRDRGGKMRIACKAFNRNCDTQPSQISSIWNFRGLAGNAWHFCDLCVLPPATKSQAVA